MTYPEKNKNEGKIPVITVAICDRVQTFFKISKSNFSILNFDFNHATNILVLDAGGPQSSHHFQQRFDEILPL